MSPSFNVTLILILIALGFLGVSLSFLIADQKKSKIALGLAIAIIVVGVFQWGADWITRIQINRRLREYQRQSQPDFDAMRQKIKEQAQTAPTAAPRKP